MDGREEYDISLLDNDALAYLVDHELEDPATGITKRVISHGISSLSEKQLYVFKKQVVDKWLNRKCKCGNHSVEGHELIALWVNDGFCGRCAVRMEKDTRLET